MQKKLPAVGSTDFALEIPEITAFGPHKVIQIKRIPNSG